VSRANCLPLEATEAPEPRILSSIGNKRRVFVLEYKANNSLTWFEMATKQVPKSNFRDQFATSFFL
jgi:hypothetical protein